MDQLNQEEIINNYDSAILKKCLENDKNPIQQYNKF